MTENNLEIFRWLKTQSEQIWENQPLKQNVSGFQIMSGTKWLPGLSKAETDEFEQVMGYKFPQIYRDYLSCMNGTDKNTLNIFASRADIKPTYDCGYYSYPRDLARIKERIGWIYEDFGVDEAFVVDNKIPHVMPIFGHRYLVMDNCGANPVLSMMGTDVIIYGDNLKIYLAREIGIENVIWKAEQSPEISVKLWLETEYEDLALQPQIADSERSEE